MIGLWLLMLVGGGLVGGFVLPRCAESLPPGASIAAVIFTGLAGEFARRRKFKWYWLLSLLLIYAMLSWLTIAFAVAVGNMFASGLCRLF
ncbi:hypothetical protein FRZ61_00240 [Hypericibacter adhaerens]|uniref:Uncharacterized protein n=1 Tax=Hypericibacter adhaerens TaxID=2602016 RepID=A0A5J6MVE7_9PROT|nr:hypothetical protein FRZ61_00240 [Hypericibacter adhaerens]